jgi:hypothetical protein
MNVAFDHDHGKDQSATDTIPAVAKRMKARDQPWALIVDENYGEGSAREHAALQPRFYGQFPFCLYTEAGLLKLYRLRTHHCSLVRTNSRDEPQGKEFDIPGILTPILTRV